MSPELQDLLDDAAREPRRPVDVTDIQRRARRSRTVEVLAAVAGTVLLLASVAVGVSQLSDGPAPAPFIEDPDATPSEPEASEPDATEPDAEAIVTAADLDAEVFQAVDGQDGADGHVLVQRPDGTSYQLPIDTATPSEVAMVVDGRGGLSWQASGDDQGTGPIVHVDGDGVSRIVVDPGSFSPPDTYRLVGGSEFALLVERSRGTTPESTTGDLLTWWAGGTGSQPDVLSRNTSGWESAVLAAASLEVTVYVLGELSGTAVVVDPPDRDASVVWRGDEPTGEEALDVDIIGSDGAFALVRTPDGAELLSIDMFADEPAVRDRVEVPLRLGTDAMDVEATELSIHTQHILVNRRADGRWLRPLVHDLRAPGTWSVLEREGRALLARPTPEAAEEPACVEDDARRNAAPEDDGELYLYATCSGAAEPWHAYRLETGEQRTGDVADDARHVLFLLFGDLPREHRDGGYRLLTRDPFSGDSSLDPIEVAAVAFDAGTLVVDFFFPDGVGIYNSGHGSATFHTLLAANLLQLPGVQVVELRESGSCERYPRFFEGDGCVRLTAAGDAPWDGQRVFDGD